MLHAVSAREADVDPIVAVFGAPDTAFEFNSPDLSGLTAYGTPDVVNADTTIPGHYFIQDDASAVALCGHFVTRSAPFTAIVLLADHNSRADFNGAGMFVGVASPGIIESWRVSYGSGPKIRQDTWTNPTTFSGAGLEQARTWDGPIYMAIRVNSTTDVDFLLSYDGRVWWKLVDSRNPGITIGSVGLLAASINANGLAAAFDFFRIWHSAKTFPGAAA